MSINPIKVASLKSSRPWLDSFSFPLSDEASGRDKKTIISGRSTFAQDQFEYLRFLCLELAEARFFEPFSPELEAERRFRSSPPSVVSAASVSGCNSARTSRWSKSTGPSAECPCSNGRIRRTSSMLLGYPNHNNSRNIWNKWMKKAELLWQDVDIAAVKLPADFLDCRMELKGQPDVDTPFSNCQRLVVLPNDWHQSPNNKNKSHMLAIIENLF